MRKTSELLQLIAIAQSDFIEFVDYSIKFVNTLKNALLISYSNSFECPDDLFYSYSNFFQIHCTATCTGGIVEDKVCTKTTYGCSFYDIDNLCRDCV